MAIREVGKLNVAGLGKLTQPGRYGDGNGLYLQISNVHTKSWVLRYQLAGRSREMGLGSLTDVSLQQAREKSREARRKLIDGEDPIDARKEKKEELRAALAKRVLFEDAAEKYIAMHKTGWRNEKHADQWAATLKTYANPIIGKLGVADVQTSHILSILEPIWTTKSETASRVRGRVESVLDWATARHHRQGDNPARWKGHLDKLLPAKTKVRRVQHQPAMGYAELPRFMAHLRETACVSAWALEFTVLTAARTGATIGALWSEIDLINGIWTVPGDRAGTKLRQDEHRVPLSKRSIEILRAVPRERGNDHVFIGTKRGQGLSNMAMLELLQGKHPDLTVHGFRSTFKDWASETTNFADIVSEMALAHVISDEVQAAYRRGELMEKRKKLMEAWAKYCATSVSTAECNVTPIRRTV